MSLLREFRRYHRDDKGSGKIVKRDDHFDGRDAIPGRQQAAANAHATETAAIVDAVAVPTRSGRLDGMTTRWIGWFPAKP
jgi:hypothetical protein